MNFIQAVNRLLRNQKILAGDDDDLASFNVTQHVTTMNSARQAIQQELIQLYAERLLPGELREGTIVAMTSQRTYNLPTNFMRFYGENPFMYPDDNTDEYLYETPGGYDLMRQLWRDYKTAEGRPFEWYYQPTVGSVKKIGLRPIPSSAYNGIIYTYEYEGSILVESENDTLPFQNESENIAFVDMASRRFAFLIDDVPIETMEADGIWVESKSTLIQLLRYSNVPNKYGRTYRACY